MNLNSVLKIVRGVFRQDPTPPFDLHWHSEPFLNGSNPDMNVDGSVTPVVFTFAPGAGEVFYLKRLRFQIDDNGVIKVGDFAGIAGALTNGVLMEWVIDTHNHTFKNLQTNEQIFMHMTESSGSFQSSGSGWIPNSFFQGGFDFYNEVITLDGDRGDKMTVTVRDDLTGINLFRMAMTYWVKA